jgi:hypothetical protein
VHTGTKRTAVLVDADYLRATIRSRDDLAALPQLVRGLQAVFGVATRIINFATFRSDDLDYMDTLHELNELRTDVRIRARSAADRRSADVWLAVTGMSVLGEVDRLALVSGDFDFLPLLEEVRSQGKIATLVWLPGVTSSALAKAADELIDLRTVVAAVGDAAAVRRLVGLIAPGAGGSVLLEIEALFRSAQQSISVIDPYVGADTMNLFAWVPRSVELCVITRRVDQDVLDIARMYVSRGSRLKLYRTDKVHDRWFRVDGRWWHSGASLKDLGRRYARITEVLDLGELAEHGDMEAQLRLPSNEIDF